MQRYCKRTSQSLLLHGPLSQTERQYAQIEKECLAIVFSSERFSQYLAGREKITVESDHKPLQSIFQKSILSAPCRLQRMIVYVV